MDVDHDALFEGACVHPSRIREYFSVKLGTRRNEIRERGGEREKVRLQCIGYQLCDVSGSEEFIGAATVNPLPVNFTHILEKSTFVLDPYGRTRDTDPENKRVRTNPSPSISSEPRLRHEEQQVPGQTFKEIAFYLPSPVFAHDQNYVALSREPQQHHHYGRTLLSMASHLFSTPNTVCTEIS